MPLWIILGFFGVLGIIGGIWKIIDGPALRNEDNYDDNNKGGFGKKSFSNDENYGGGYYPYVKFTQFTITNYWVGLLGDVKIFNRFIANAWGIIKFQHYTISGIGD